MSEFSRDMQQPDAVLGVGAVLRDTRAAGGISVEEVAHALKLSTKQVLAIEAEDFASLKGHTFARGFVGNYARLLGIDPAPLLAELDRGLRREEVKLLPPSNAQGHMPVSDGIRSVPRSLAVLAVAAMVGLVILMAFDRYNEPARQAAARSEPVVAPEAAPAAPPAAAAQPPEAPPPEPAQAVVEAAPAEAPQVRAMGAAVSVPAAVEPPLAATSTVAPLAAPAATAHRLTFNFDKESWVEVRDGAGRLLFSRVNPAGSSRVVEGTPPFSLVVGNAVGVRLSYDDKPVDLRPHTGVSVARFTLE